MIVWVAQTTHVSFLYVCLVTVETETTFRCMLDNIQLNIDNVTVMRSMWYIRRYQGNMKNIYLAQYRELHVLHDDMELFIVCQYFDLAHWLTMREDFLSHLKQEGQIRFQVVPQETTRR